MSAANETLYHNFHLRHRCYGVVSDVVTHGTRTRVFSRRQAANELARTLAERAVDVFEQLDARLRAAKDFVELLKQLASPNEFRVASPTESEMEVAFGDRK